MDFDKVRWKLADDLTVEEASLIVQNKALLNDEEKAAFADVLQAAEPLPDNPLDAAIDQAVDDPANQDPAAVIQDPANPTPAAPAVGQPPVDATPPVLPAAPAVPDNVVTQDKLDTYLAEKKKEWDAEGKTAAEQAAEAAKVQQFFDAGYAPKDWNDYTNVMLEKVAPLIEQRVLATLDKRNAEFAEQQKKIKATQDQIFQQFEKEFETLATSKLLPDPKEKPAEFAAAKKQIIAIGDAHGKNNVTDAYKLWAIIPVEHGGGLVTGAPAVDPAAAQKAKEAAQKAAAGRIGSGRGAVGTVKPGAPSYAKIHGGRMEDLLEERMSQPT